MTNLYATYSNKVRFKSTTAKEIEILFGLHLATGIFGYPCLKMYWETNISIPLFTENMARDQFFELRKNLHLVDNTAIPGNSKDAFIKVRPIFDAVRNRCLDLPLEKNLCVDEQIVPFTGKHVAKQYIKGKPCPWGLNFFFLCGKHGQAYDFILYQSSSPELENNLTKKNWIRCSCSPSSYKENWRKQRSPAILRQLFFVLPPATNFKTERNYGCLHYPYQQICKAIIAKQQRNEQKTARLCSRND